MDYDQLFAEFNVGAARQTCLSAEVRLRSEHNLRERKKFKRKCARHTDLLKEKDTEIAISVVEAAEAARVSELNSLKDQTTTLEAEKSTLEGQIATLESATVIKDTVLASSNAKITKLTQDMSNYQLSCDELSIKAASLESERDGLVDQDAQVKVLSDRVAEPDSELVGMAVHLDEEFYPRFLTNIDGRRWVIGHGLRLAVMKCLQSTKYVTALGTALGLAIDKGMQTGLVAGIDHGKAGRSVTDVATYDPSVEAKYVSTVLAFRDLDFNLLSQLESQKDTSIADITSLLCLEGPSAETPMGSQLQPSYEQLLLPIHRKEDNVVIGETSLSDSLDAVHAHVQKIKEGASSRRLSISDAMGPLVDPLSSENLVGEASTSRVPTTVAATTALVVANVNSVAPISVTDYGVLDAEPQPEASHSPKVVFEKEDLDTTPDHPSAR
ncbi:hypothetical protein Tco_0823277 [Tanacetum coccineum]|uniref:Transposase (Putative), gypsy type n=1 Tax=Tanacetum coccineum TaxID=301880 RepID=A0ABQ5AIE5_9ASTR